MALGVHWASPGESMTRATIMDTQQPQVHKSTVNRGSDPTRMSSSHSVVGPHLWAPTAQAELAKAEGGWSDGGGEKL